MENSEATRNRVLDYIEGWYEGNGARMERALSPHLAKRRVVSSEEIWDVSKEWMVTATGNGRGRIDEPEKGIKEITILDQTETIASVKLVSNQFVDYLHFVKIDGDWVIVNVLWDYVSK
jgi:hypothetical protein